MQHWTAQETRNRMQAATLQAFLILILFCNGGEPDGFMDRLWRW